MPLINGSSWSSCRKMTSPFVSSIRFGCTGLKSCSAYTGIFFHGCVTRLVLAAGAARAFASVCAKTALCAPNVNPTVSTRERVRVVSNSRVHSAPPALFALGFSSGKFNPRTGTVAIDKYLVGYAPYTP